MHVSGAIRWHVHLHAECSAVSPWRVGRPTFLSDRFVCVHVGMAQRMTHVGMRFAYFHQRCRLYAVRVSIVLEQ